MRVEEGANGMTVEPNHVYVIPPNATMSISNHTSQLGPRGESRGVHMSIDHFTRALAEQQGDRAIGVNVTSFFRNPRVFDALKATPGWVYPGSSGPQVLL